MRDDFAVFILSHGRANDILTVDMLHKGNYTGDWFVVIDDEDDQEPIYRERFGEHVIQFNKLAESLKTDTGDLDNDRRVGVFARNAIQDIAKEKGYKYHLQLDDDFRMLSIRLPKGEGTKLTNIRCYDFDTLFSKMLDFMDATDVSWLSFGLSSDYLGGAANKRYLSGLFPKTMGSFLMRADDITRFKMRMNDDITTCIHSWFIGKPNYTFTKVMVETPPTQRMAGGMTDIYTDKTIVHQRSSTRNGRRGGTMRKYDFLIVGAGLAGSVLAERLTDAGASVIMLDKRAQAGGNLYCKNMDGIIVHRYGAHIFRTNDNKVWEYINKFSSFNRFTNCPVANYNGELYNLPFNMNTFHALYGVNLPSEARCAIDNDRVRCQNPTDLEQHCLDMVGRKVYEKLIKGYTEKQWGKKCSELPASIIRRIPLRFTYDNNYFNDKYQGIPEDGYNILIDRMLSKARIQLLTDFNDDREYWLGQANKVVYTGPLDDLFDSQFGELQYRSLRFEDDLFNENNHQGVAVVNYTGNDVPYTRTIEHKHFLFGDDLPYTVITREYPIKYIHGVNEPYYPMEDEKNIALCNIYKALADKCGVFLCGRLAEYRYYDMQDTIKSALALSGRLLKGGC